MTITIKEAYNLFIAKFPEAATDSIADWGDFYGCSRYSSSDTADDYWKIDKKTGEITELDFMEYSKEVDKHEGYEIRSYKIADILQSRAS